MAWVGQASLQARHPSSHRDASRAGRPRKRSGSSTASSGTRIVRRPCWIRAFNIRNTMPSHDSYLEVVTRVREIEALVAERKIGDLPVAHDHREREPVVERRVDDLVPGEMARIIRDGPMRDLSAPSLDQRGDASVRAGGARRVREWPVLQLLQLFSNELDRTLYLGPAEHGPSQDVPRLLKRHRDVREA